MFVRECCDSKLKQKNKIAGADMRNINMLNDMELYQALKLGEQVKLDNLLNQKLQVLKTNVHRLKGLIVNLMVQWTDLVKINSNKLKQNEQKRKMLQCCNEVYELVVKNYNDKEKFNFAIDELRKKNKFTSDCSSGSEASTSRSNSPVFSSSPTSDKSLRTRGSSRNNSPYSSLNSLNSLWTNHSVSRSPSPVSQGSGTVSTRSSKSKDVKKNKHSFFIGGNQDSKASQTNSKKPSESENPDEVADSEMLRKIEDEYNTLRGFGFGLRANFLDSVKKYYKEKKGIELSEKSYSEKLEAVKEYVQSNTRESIWGNFVKGKSRTAEAYNNVMQKEESIVVRREGNARALENLSPFTI